MDEAITEVIGPVPDLQPDQTPTDGDASPISTNGDAPAEETVKEPLPVLSVSQILAAKDLTEETIEIPEWGGSIVVRSFSKKGQQEVRIAATVDDEIDENRLEMFMFLRGVINPKFTDDQYEQLREKNAAIMDRILSRLMALSGMDKESAKAAEAKFRN